LRPRPTPIENNNAHARTPQSVLQQHISQHSVLVQPHRSDAGNPRLVLSETYDFALSWSCQSLNSTAFTKALICLSKYGDELSIYATPERLSLSATNSSKSAYCRIKYEKDFFTRYRVADHQEGRNDWTSDNAENITLTGQLLTKVCLTFGILKILIHLAIVAALYPETSHHRKGG
jgi:hypothetical protein